MVKVYSLKEDPNVWCNYEQYLGIELSGQIKISLRFDISFK